MRLILTFLMLCAAAGCEKEPPTSTAPAPTGTPVIYTTFYPTEYFAATLIGDAADVICPLPDDADPIFWRPSREQIEAFQRAELIIINGAEFEKWVDAASLPESRVVDTAAGFSDSWVTYESVTHSHGAGGEHTHEGIDGHTWVDPVNAIAQAEAIRDALVTAFPEQESSIRVAFTALRADLETVHQRLQAVTPALEGVQLLASHPAYNYLVARYGWEIANLDLDPEAAIDARGMHEVTEKLDADAARKIMLWESAPTEQTVSKLEAIGIQCVTFSPCEMLDAEARASGATYLTVMRDNLARLEAALGDSGG